MLVISSFLSWTYHPDLNKFFTGFFSENNIYGKPGYVFIVLSIFAIVFFGIQKVWAKRWNLFICAIILAYAIKTFIVYSGCYRGICPAKQTGIWLMLAATLLMMGMSLLPDLNLKGESSK